MMEVYGKWYQVLGKVLDFRSKEKYHKKKYKLIWSTFAPYLKNGKRERKKKKCINKKVNTLKKKNVIKQKNEQKFEQKSKNCV